MKRIGCQVLVPVGFRHPYTPAELTASPLQPTRLFKNIFSDWCVGNDTDTDTGVWLEMRRAQRGSHSHRARHR